MNDNNKTPESNGASARAAASRATSSTKQSERKLHSGRDDVTQLRDVARQTLQDWEALLRDRLARQPYATLAVAAGFGYVLGGGLPPFLVRTLLAAGGRIAVENLIAQRVAQTD